MHWVSIEHLNQLKAIMTDKPKATKIEFAPGCFDNFDGTQEELDELVSEIHRMFKSGELEENSHEVDIEDLDEDIVEAIMRSEEDDNRNLQ
jgi:hypothetical protein